MRPAYQPIAAGCDNLEIGDYVVPPLTTIEFDRYGIGRAAASGLVARLHGQAVICDLDAAHGGSVGVDLRG